MHKIPIGFAAAAVLIGTPVLAAEMPLKAPAPLPPVLWSWTGFYIGGHIGSAMGLNNIADPLGPSIFGDLVHSPGFFGGGQIGYNWQAPNSNWVFGIEADASLANLDGTNTCYAFSGTFTSFNCRAHTDAFGTFTGRVGWAFGPFDRSLLYVKGGAAWSHSDVDTIINNNLFGIAETSSSSFTAPGGTVGAGAEFALTPHWTVRAEYDYMDFGKSNVAAPTPSVTTGPAVGMPVGAFVAVPGTKVSQQMHAFELGLNYKFGPDTGPFPTESGLAWPFAAPVASNFPLKAAPAATDPGWQFEFGGRYWLSSGRLQRDIANARSGAQNPTLNISRLTWDNLTGNSGEAFGRIDTPWNVFVKGFIGGGGISGGKINDEDWGLGTSHAAVNDGYSNTVGNARGNLNYATVDVGYDFFRGSGYKVGGFIGYNEYRDNKSSFTCSQIALPANGICNPPSSGFILGENDNWQSLRIGANAEAQLAEQWKLVADVAFLPYVQLNGQNFHPMIPFIADETGTGIGTQAELFLNYYLTPQFSVGIGGRYWAMWTTSGTNCREPPQPTGTAACPAPLQDQQVKTERYGLLLQAAYRFGVPPVAETKY
ncbi:MAG: outer membrane beta-barrel protein [Xanthobacteraceae bacterium]